MLPVSTQPQYICCPYVALGAAGADYRPERLHVGFDAGVLAIDSYDFWPGEGSQQTQPCGEANV